MRHALILAGGSGSRFWPLSRPYEPKQFLKVCSEKSMLEQTVHRVLPLIKKENIYIACSIAHSQRMKSSISKFKIPLKNIFFEPQSRNTLAPIVFLANRIHKIDPEGILAILPCDHFIKNRPKFLRSLKDAMDAADKGCIATFGVIPNRPETGYGYIRVKKEDGGEKIESRRKKVYKVDRFIEKPDLAKAKRFLKDKRYYWNSGIFVFKAKTILGEVNRLMPNVYKVILKINTMGNMKKLWKAIPALSLDYAVMEKTKNIILLPLDCGWVDLGSWQAIAEIIEKDKEGNIFRGNCINIESKNTIVWSSGPSVLATLGLKDIIIVNTKDAILVCSKDRTQDVKRISQMLHKKNIKPG